MKELSVCVGTVCHLQGSYSVISLFKQMIEENRLHDSIEINAVHCTQNCRGDGVSVLFEGRTYAVGLENARSFFKAVVMPDVLNMQPDTKSRPA